MYENEKKKMKKNDIGSIVQVNNLHLFSIIKILSLSLSRSVSLSFAVVEIFFLSCLFVKWPSDFLPALRQTRVQQLFDLAGDEDDWVLIAAMGITVYTDLFDVHELHGYSMHLLGHLR